jgi:uncharacterized membrane-anchored protein YjiN (DUF445 family)
VPTLTEVVDRSESSNGLSQDADIAQRLMAELQAHIDRVLDARVRAALEPVLQQIIARVTEETRRELASTLRDGISRALAQEMSRHRGGSGPR